MLQIVGLTYIPYKSLQSVVYLKTADLPQDFLFLQGPTYVPEWTLMCIYIYALKPACLIAGTPIFTGRFWARFPRKVRAGSDGPRPAAGCPS